MIPFNEFVSDDAKNAEANYKRQQQMRDAEQEAQHKREIEAERQRNKHKVTIYKNDDGKTRIKINK